MVDPTIGAAITAGVPWLGFFCPACGQVGSVDLRTLDRHRGASIQASSVGVVPPVLAQRPVREAPNLTAERP